MRSEIEIVSPFDLKDPENIDQLYKLYYSFYEIFEGKKGVNDGLILFSLNILGWKAMKNFLWYILGEVKVKRTYYLELDWKCYTPNIE